MVEVAVIGAGVSGLLAARHLLRCGLRPSIFEQGQAIGGAWNSKSTSYKMWKGLTQNLSKYTCCFSDYPWLDYEEDFASQRDMQEYLERYASTFIEEDYFNFGCTVTKVKKSHKFSKGSKSQASSQYEVEWLEEGSSKAQWKEFDGVVVASGFFSSPVVPDSLKFLANDDANRVIHSSLYTSPDKYADQTVAIIGGSFSAHEIAVSVQKEAKKVVNVFPRKSYILPRYLPYKGGFVPIDVALYSRSCDGPQTSEMIHFDTEVECSKWHNKLRSMLGKCNKQSAIGFPDTAYPPLVSISDHYLDLVLSGKIDSVQGKVVGAHYPTSENENKIGNSDSINIELEDGRTFEGIDRIIACTGYRNQLDFLDKDILETLQYEKEDAFAPLVQCYDTFHPDLPGLAFVGMYKGPYVGVAELQARLAAGLISNELNLSASAITEALTISENIRQQSKVKAKSRFPHFDYIGHMDTLAKQIDLLPLEQYLSKGSMVSPSFYQPNEEIMETCKLRLDKLKDIAVYDGSKKLIPRLSLNALIGKWSFERTITEMSSPGARPQKVSGEIFFSVLNDQKMPSPARSSFDSIRYREDGLFELPTGKKLQVFREYDYVYAQDAIEIYFVEGGERAHMFLSLKFDKKENGYWVATSDHLCIKDLYRGTFKIAFDGVGARDISMTYRVKGPAKNYESVTYLQPIT